ncbi:MAG: tetratricopeptide repeat protein [Acidobacteria bacterium]|nr:tetratricopeptide repeat protein [Acidobacteriota bacterium]
MNQIGSEWPPPAPSFSNLFEIAEVRDIRWFAKRYWKWVAASSALAAILGLVWVCYFPPRYVSRATVRFLPPQVAGRFVNPNFSMEVGQRIFALSQLMGSRLTAAKLIETFTLYPERRRFQTVEDLTAKFSQDLQVLQVGNGPGEDQRSVPTMRISFAYPDAEKAQKVVQKLIEQVYEENRKYRGDQSLGTTEFLDEQLATAETRVLETEQRLGEAQDSIGLTVSQTRLGQNTSRSYVIDSRLRDLRNDRRQQEERKSAKKAEWEQLEIVQRRIETRPVEFYIPEFEGMQHYWHLRDRVANARSALERIRERYSETMPDSVSAEKHLKECEIEVERFHKERGARLKNRDLEANAAKIMLAKLELQALDKESGEQIREEGELRAEAQRLREQQVTPAGQEVELLVAKREYDAAKEHHNQLLKKHEESKAASEMERRGQGESVEMLEPASKPSEAEQPTMWVRLAMIWLAGVAMALAGSLLHALRDARVLHGGHIEKWAGMPVLANLGPDVLPKRAARAAITASSLVFVMLLSGCGVFDESADSMYRKGMAAEKGGKASVALLEYRRAVRKDARHGASFEAIGRLAIRMGEVAAAREALARAVELSPEDQVLLRQLTETSYQIYFDDPGRPTTLLREVEDLAGRLQKKWPALPDGYRISAQVLMERHRTDEAVALLRAASGTVSANETLRAQMAAALYRTGQADEAEQVLTKLIEDKPLYADAYDLLYLQRMQSQKGAAAREVLAAKWEKTQEMEAGMQLAAHDDARGDRTAARRMIENLKPKAEQKPLGMARIGDFWLERAEWADAQAAYEYGRDHEANRRADYVGRLAEWHLSQGLSGAARQLVEKEYEANRGSDVLEAYLAAVRLGEVPQDRRIEERKRLETLMQRMPDSPFVRYHLGRAYLLERRARSAAEQFERSVKLDANYAAGWLALAEVELRNGNPRLAEMRAETVLRTNPRQGRAMLLRARSLSMRGKYAEAQKALAEVIAMEPANPDARFLLAVSEAGQGKTAEAVRELELGSKEQPKDTRWPLAMAALQSRGGDVAGARKTIEQALGQGGRNPLLLEQLASVQIDLKDGQGARRTYQELLALDAKNLEYQLGAAGALALSGDRERSLKQYQELQIANAGDVRVWLQPAALLQEMGRGGEAKRLYETVLRLNPNHPMALNNLAWLLLERRESERVALDLVQRAKRVVRQSAEVDGTLAAAYTRLEMHRSATAVYEEMLSYLPVSERPRVEKLLAEARKKKQKEGNS